MAKFEYEALLLEKLPEKRGWNVLGFSHGRRDLTLLRELRPPDVISPEDARKIADQMAVTLTGKPHAEEF